MLEVMRGYLDRRGDGPLTIDLDSTICETYGLAKEGARHHGYPGQLGYHPLLARARTTGAGTGEVLMSRLREGRVNTARAAAHFLRETVGRVRYGGVGGQLTVRADRGFYAHAILAVCCEMPVRFSITIRRHARLRNISEAIPETDWTPIPSYLDFGDGADHRRPSTDANCQNLPGQSLLHVHCPPFRHRHHPVRWIRAKGAVPTIDLVRSTPQSTKRTLAGLVILNALACLIWSSLSCRSDDRSDIRGHIWRTRSRRRCTTSRPPASRRTTYLSRAGKVPKRTAVRNGCWANQIEHQEG